MEIIGIFEPHLYAVKFDDGENEFDKLMDFWFDKELLSEYFDRNDGLQKFENITNEEAVLLTSEYAEKLYDKIDENQTNLDSLFERLEVKYSANKELEKQKLKSFWLRIYAIKIESKYFVITGGAIKQSIEMKDHPDTEFELQKIERCKSFFKEQGITDIEGLFELIIT